MNRLRITNARIVSPGNGINKKGEVCLADGLIVSVGKGNGDFSADTTIDAAGMLLCPGIIDMAADFREPGLEHKATIATESVAAINAGITTVVLAAETNPVVDSAAVVELIHQREASSGLVRLLPLGALTVAMEGKQLTEMASLRDAGCIALCNGPQPQNNPEVMRRALEYAASFGLTVFVQAEDPLLRNNGVMHEGQVSTRLGLPGIPATAETVAVSQYLLLIEQTGIRGHFCRLSCARSVEMIRDARDKGLPVTADISINNLFLSEMDVDGFDAARHLRPPLRTVEDRNALLAGLVNGSIDAVCSDHQPHDDDAKCAPFSETEPGASGIELLAPQLMNLVERGELPLERAVAVMTSNPAAILGLDSGVIECGHPADLFLFDGDAPWTVTADTLQSTGKNTAFMGWEMPGRASHTIRAGKLLHAPA